jgi:hypothetical protein
MSIFLQDARIAVEEDEAQVASCSALRTIADATLAST